MLVEGKIVYHGSKGGIKGDISPSSRVLCDFGRGFYTCDSPEQVKGLVVRECRN